MGGTLVGDEILRDYENLSFSYKPFVLDPRCIQGL